MAVQDGAGTEVRTGQGLMETRKRGRESKAQKQVVGDDRKPASGEDGSGCSLN